MFCRPLVGTVHSPCSWQAPGAQTLQLEGDVDPTADFLPFEGWLPGEAAAAPPDGASEADGEELAREAAADDYPPAAALHEPIRN